MTDAIIRSALEHCLFCGASDAKGEGQYTQASFSGVQVVDRSYDPYVCCGTCGARTATCDSAGEAIIAWNTRASNANVALWHGGWSYDFNSYAGPRGLVEMAFDFGIGICNVKICERRITKNMATYDRPLPVDQYEYGYFDENGKEISEQRSPYAWRRIAIPPPPSWPDVDKVKDVETYIHNHCPDNVRDHVARLTEIASRIQPVTLPDREAIAQVAGDHLSSAERAHGTQYDIADAILALKKEEKA